MTDYKSPRSDKITPGRKGKEVVGVVYCSRIVAKRLGISRELARRVINATTDLWWEELLRGRWIKLGASGRVRVAERGPYVMAHPNKSGDLLSVPNVIALAGSLTPRFKGAWYDVGGIHYVPEEDIGNAAEFLEEEEEDPEWW